MRNRGVQVADERLPENLALFVNTHPAEFKCEGLEESLLKIREQHPLRPIVLEVHESMLNADLELSNLRSKLDHFNIQLALHDFGSSSVQLMQICDMLPEFVKFDLELIRGIEHASIKKQNFISTIVASLKELGVTPIAEGVEKDSDQKIIRELGFACGQGFLFGRPSSIDDCTLASQKPSIQNIASEEKQTTGNHVSVSPAKAESVHDSEWLLQQSASAYTVQVHSAISKERALSHIEEQSLPGEFAIFEKQGKGRKLFIVVFLSLIHI